MKIVILDGYTENPGDLSWSVFEELGEVTVYDRTEKSQIVERIGAAEAVLTNKTPITAETMAACRNLHYIGVLATGYNVGGSRQTRRYRDKCARLQYGFRGAAYDGVNTGVVQPCRCASGERQRW